MIRLFAQYLLLYVAFIAGALVILGFLDLPGSSAIDVVVSIAVAQMLGNTYIKKYGGGTKDKALQLALISVLAKTVVVIAVFILLREQLEQQLAASQVSDMSLDRAFGVIVAIVMTIYLAIFYVFFKWLYPITDKVVRRSEKHS